MRVRIYQPSRNAMQSGVARSKGWVLEFAREDECVEITPEDIRIRKVVLDANERLKAARARARA